MSIARCRTVVGSLYGLMRNALGLNVATSLESQELSCTVAPDRRLVVLGHEPIAGFARDHGTVADEAAMLALHTLDSTTLLAEPRFVAPGDSCIRTDDPGWRWYCITNHGQALADWERRPLAGAIAGAQPLDADLTAIAAQGVSAWGLTRLADSGATAAKNALGIQRADIGDASTAGRALMAVSTPSKASVPVISSAGAVTTAPLSSLGGGGGTGSTARQILCSAGYARWAYSSGFWSGSGGAFSIGAAFNLVGTIDSGTYPTICRIGSDAEGNAMIMRLAAGPLLNFYIAAGGTWYRAQADLDALLADSRRHTLVCTSSGSGAAGIHCFWDGVPLSLTVSNEGSTTPGSPTMYIASGSITTALEYWVGAIADVSIWVGSTLTADDAADYHATLSAGSPTWRLEFADDLLMGDSVGGAVPTLISGWLTGLVVA